MTLPPQINITSLLFAAILCAATPAYAQVDMGRAPVASSSTVSAGDAELLADLLESNLASVADEDRWGRRVGGYVMLGLGAGAAVGGVTTLALAENDDARIVGVSLIGGGALLSGLSLIPFRVRSQAERLYAEYEEMPDETPADLRSKVVYGDRRFEELAHKARRDRIIGGVTTIVGAAATSLLIADGSDRERLHAFVWPALGGVSSILIKSRIERRYASYARAKGDLLGSAGSPEVGFSILPMPNGVSGYLSVRF